MEKNCIFTVKRFQRFMKVINYFKYKLKYTNIIIMGLRYVYLFFRDSEINEKN